MRVNRRKYCNLIYSKGTALRMHGNQLEHRRHIVLLSLAPRRQYMSPYNCHKRSVLRLRFLVVAHIQGIPCKTLAFIGPPNKIIGSRKIKVKEICKSP